MTPRRPLKWHAVTGAPLRQRLQAPVTLDVHGWAVLWAQNGVVIALQEDAHELDYSDAR